MENFYSNLFNGEVFPFADAGFSAAKPKTNLYWITLSEAATNNQPQKGKAAKPRDLSEKSKKIAEQIEQLASESVVRDSVKVNRDVGGLEKDGIFSMTAPESFAVKVRQLEGVQKVEQPAAPKKRAHASAGKRR